MSNINELIIKLLIKNQIRIKLDKYKKLIINVPTVKLKIQNNTKN